MPPARRDRQTPGDEQRDLQRAILAATEALLAQRRFDEISVAQILGAAGISRASFYFYFESKHAVLAELVRQAVSEAQAVSAPWLEHTSTTAPRESLHRGNLDGARLWRTHAPVLRAIVENWRSDPALRELWSDMMGGLTAVAAERIERDRAAGIAPVSDIDAHSLAAVLTWMGERAYYLAAIGHPAFDDEQQLVDTMTHIWVTAIYGGDEGTQLASS